MAKARRPSNDSMVPYVGENLSALRQYTSTVTGTNWTTTRCVIVPYQTLGGTWRCRFNINGTFAGAANSNQNNPLTIAGLDFTGLPNQAIAALSIAGQGVSMVSFAANVYSGQLYAFWSGSVNYNSIWEWSGDVELAAKPSFVP